MDEAQTLPHKTCVFTVPDAHMPRVHTSLSYTCIFKHITSTKRERESNCSAVSYNTFIASSQQMRFPEEEKQQLINK